jgi:diguanylate cyclase (GGDEF)-like protein/PAS domain S-box-containing protein
MRYLDLVSAAPDSSLLYAGHYDPVLVALSIAIAVFSSYTALLVAELVARGSGRRKRRKWIVIGGLSMAAGTWAMHFVGMLALSLPCRTGYDPFITLVSMVPALLASTLALSLVSHARLGPAKLAGGGLLFGAGIGAMHYSGMAALRLDGLVRYDITLFLLSIVVAVVLATLALWVKFRLPVWLKWPPLGTRIAAASVMGLAVSGMHYTGMAAAYFVRQGDAGGPQTQMTPTLLASVVLVVTAAIIIATIMAVYATRSSLSLKALPFRMPSMLMVAWCVVAWLYSGYYKNFQTDQVYEREFLGADQAARSIADSIRESISLTRGVPKALAFDAGVREVLSRHPPSASETAETPESRRRKWQSDPELRELNARFELMAGAHKVDVIWLMDASGKCIAASNAGQPQSFVGIDYRDRLYFRMASQGVPGNQYAVGRATSIPGLFFSHPVSHNGRVIGVVTVKRNISAFSLWTAQSGAFLSDANGIVVHSPDRSLELRAMPGSGIARLAEDARQAQYRRTAFAPLANPDWRHERYPSLLRIAGHDAPVLLASEAIPEGSVTVHVPRYLGDLDRIRVERYGLFVLLLVAGGMLIFTIAAFTLVRGHEERIRLLLASVGEGIYGLDLDGRCTFINPAALRMLGYPRADALIGREMHALIHHTRQDGTPYAPEDCPIRRTFARGEDCQVSDEVFWRADGGAFPVEYHAHAQRKDGVIIGVVVSFRDITERKRSEERINQLAYFDPLTGLPNRRLLMDRLGQALVASERSREYGALMVLDLDNFKTLNDTQGHDVGDRLLVEVAGRLAASVRKEDSVSRLGGDEYVVMVEGLGTAEAAAARQAEMIADKIRAALYAPYEVSGNDQLHHGSASIGLTLFLGKGQAMETLMKQADVALYQAKDAGRNAIRFFSPEMQAAIDARSAMETALRQGMSRGELRLFFQPQVDSAGRLIGAEALLRWFPVGGAMVPPGDFIPMAEETGLILPIGRWVLDAACAQLKRWQDGEGTRHLHLSVNVSARQFHQPDFVDQVRGALAESGADPAGLQLELTESVVLSPLRDVVERMQQLDALGVGFSLDDFGTGYSSLSYLKRLPLKQIKVDQSFVRDIASDPNDAAIVRAILAMARTLGLQAIAEGVETEAQRDFLRESGCSAFQGYLFGRPVPIEEWEIRFGR